VTGPNKDASREALRRLGAPVTVVPDETKPRLIYFADLVSGNTAMHVVLPATPWWHCFWLGWRPQHALMVVGRGTYWDVASVDEKGYRVKYYPLDRGHIDSRRAVLIAGLWVNREKVVERRER
jgi:hypothetical protein